MKEEKVLDAEICLKNNYSKAEELLKDVDEVERFLQRLEL